MIIVDRISELPNGDPVDAGTPVLLRKEIDGTLLDTQLTDIDGWVSFQMNGSPGPVYTEITVGGETRYRYGRAVAQVGSWFEGEWQQFMDLVQNGVVRSKNASALQVVTGTGLQVRVLPGAAVIDGILARYYTTENISISSNGSGQTRHDLIVLRAHTGGSQVGRVELVTVEGSPAATPEDPYLAPIPDVAQLVLGRVRVQSGVSQILGSDIADRRLEASFLPDGAVTTVKLRDGAVTTPKLGTGAVTTPKLANDSVTRSKLDLDDVDLRYAIRNEVITALAQRRPRANSVSSAANQNVTTEGIRQVTHNGNSVGEISFGSLVPGAWYSVQVALGFRIYGDEPSSSASIGYRVIGSANEGANTAFIPLDSGHNWFSWTWVNVNQASAGGAITVRPITSWGMGEYTVNYVSMAVKLDLVE